MSDAIVHFGRIRPASPALIEGSITLNYGEFATLLGRAAAYLQQRGIRESERVGVALPNSIDHLLIFFALLRLGATPVEISPELPAGVIEGVIRRLDISSLFCAPGARLSAPGLVEQVDAGWRARLPQGGDARGHGGPESTRMIVLSSGSTGEPKGVVITQQERLAGALELTDRFDGNWSVARPGCFLLLGPMAFAGFHCWVCYQILLGGAIAILETAYAEPDGLFNAIAAHDDSICMTTPTLCRALLEQAERSGMGSALLPRMQLMICGGQMLLPEEKRGMERLVTPHFYESYGAADGGNIATLRPGDIAAKAESVGRAKPDVEIEIVSPAGSKLPAGTMGRLRYRRRAGTRRSMIGADASAEGWHYPGDLAILDAEGFLTIKGRVADLILHQGVEIAPGEIEAVITELPDVADVVVLPRPAVGLNGNAAAIILRRGPIEVGEIGAHYTARLPAERRPRLEVYFSQNLPLLPSGKVDRVTLRGMIDQGQLEGF